MEVRTVLAVLRQLTAIEANREENALMLCGNALSVLLPRLRAGCDDSDPRIAFAAAADAARKLLLGQTAGEGPVSEFSAGDIRVTQEPGQALEAAQRLYEQAMADLAGVLIDDTFYCGRTGK